LLDPIRFLFDGLFSVIVGSPVLFDSYGKYCYALGMWNGVAHLELVVILGTCTDSCLSCRVPAGLEK